MKYVDLRDTKDTKEKKKNSFVHVTFIDRARELDQSRRRLLERADVGRDKNYFSP